MVAIQPVHRVDASRRQPEKTISGGKSALPVGSQKRESRAAIQKRQPAAEQIEPFVMITKTTTRFAFSVQAQQGQTELHASRTHTRRPDSEFTIRAQVRIRLWLIPSS